MTRAIIPICPLFLGATQVALWKGSTYGGTGGDNGATTPSVTGETGSPPTGGPVETSLETVPNYVPLAPYPAEQFGKGI